MTQSQITGDTLDEVILAYMREQDEEDAATDLSDKNTNQGDPQMCNLSEKPATDEFNDTDGQKTNPGTTTARLRQHLEAAGDGTPVVMMEDLPTQPIKIDTIFREPDFDDDVIEGETTLIPTGDEK
jgi:hypothetical protein